MTNSLRNFNKDRWKLLRVILADGALKDGAKNVAVALLTQAAGRDSGRAQIKFKAIAEAIAMRPDTVYRHMKALAARRYVEALETYRGGAIYVFLADNLAHGNVVHLGEELGHTSENDEQNSDMHPKNSDIHPTSPTPPYKEHQNLSKNAGARPAPHLRAFVKSGSWQATEWGTWLGERRELPLAALHRLHVEGGYDLPWAIPPSRSDEVATGIALAVIKWAKEEARVNAA